MDDEPWLKQDHQNLHLALILTYSATLEPKLRRRVI